MLTGKIAFITGASKGIGKAIALKLAERGASVVINCRSNMEIANEVVEQIKVLGGKALALQGDISNVEQVENMIKQTIEQFGRLDILVNNAGITKDKLMLRMKEEDFQEVVDVNLKGAFYCIKQATSIMMKQKSGRIINISSIVGLIGNAGQSNYAAAKAGLIGMTKSVAKELGGRGITVNVIAPGFIQTDMTEVLPEKVKSFLQSNIPLKRLGDPVDVANLVAFLASEEASYITGQVINVDGGMVM